MRARLRGDEGRRRFIRGPNWDYTPQVALPASQTASAASSGHPIARLARFAASVGGSEGPQRAAVMRCPLKPAEASETSQAMGGPMISGRSIFSRGHPVGDHWRLGWSARHQHIHRDRAAFQLFRPYRCIRSVCTKRAAAECLVEMTQPKQRQGTVYMPHWHNR